MRRRGRIALTAAAACVAAGVAAGPAIAAFPGLNGQIAFERDGHIVIKSPGDLSGGTPLTSLGANSDANWSPDGLRIAFVSTRTGTAQVWTMLPTALDQRQLTFESGDVSAPAWSPDGTRMTYDVSNGTDRDVVVLAVGGGSRIVVAGGTGNQSLPVFTPDGQSVVFEDTTTGGLSIVGATGVGRRAFLSDADQADFSPDGTRMVVRRTDIEQLQVVGADGSGGTAVLNGPGTRPVWSPDGSSILFHRTGGMIFQGLWRVPSTGGTATRETNGASLDFSPDWQPIGAVPVITGLPTPLVAGAPGATLTVDGRGFAVRSVVRWNGADRPTTWVSPTRLTAQLPAADVAAPGSAQVTVFTSPSGGGLSAPATATIPAPPPPPPRILLATGRLQKVTWRESRVRGNLRVTGTIERAGRVEVALLRGARVAQRRVLTLPAGAFARTLPLAGGLLPGRYTVRLREPATPAGQVALVAAQGAVTLGAPKEGVVATRFVSALQNGPPARTLRSASRIYATFRFAALPKPSKKLTTRWFGPGGIRTAATGKPRRRVVTSFVSLRGGLPAGTWRCEVRAGGTLVAVASVRLRR